MVSGFLSCFELKLALAELRRATGSLEAVLLTFLHARVAGQEAGLLQGRAQLGVVLQQRAGQAVADGAGLAGAAAADNVDNNVELAFGAGEHQRAAGEQLQGVEADVIVDITAVDGELAGAVVHAHAGDRVLAAAGAVEIFLGFVHGLPP